MANHDLQERLARQVADYGYGALNSVAPTEFKDKVGHDTSFVTAARKAVVKSLQPDALVNLSQIKAIVLFAWRQKAVLHGNEKKELVHVKARIPEIDIVPPPRALPIDNDRDDVKADWPSISAHDTFVAQDASLELPQPGAIISVKYGNYRQRRDPVYEALIAQPQTPGDIASSPGKAFEKADCETGYSKQDLSDLHQKMEPKPAPATEPPTGDLPIVGFMVDQETYKGYYEVATTGPGGTGASEPTSAVFQKPKNYDWVKKLVENGVNYLSYRIHGPAASAESLGLTSTQRGDTNPYYMKYTKDLTGLETTAEMLKVLEEGKKTNPEFEVHAWGDSGIGAYSNDSDAQAHRFNSYYKSPVSLEDAQFNAIKEANTVAKVFKNFEGKIANYHWHYNHLGIRHGQRRNTLMPRDEGAPELFPQAQISDELLQWNGEVTKSFISAFREKAPEVKIWFAGYFETLPSDVLNLFDYFQPSSLVPEIEKHFEVEYSENILKHTGLNGGKEVHWIVAGIPWQGSKTADEQILKYAPNIKGVSFYTLSSLMWQSYPEAGHDEDIFARIKNFRQNFVNTQ